MVYEIKDNKEYLTIKPENKYSWVIIYDASNGRKRKLDGATDEQILFFRKITGKVC